jgi:hypothetical protein
MPGSALVLAILLLPDHPLLQKHKFVTTLPRLSLIA